jgi:hypothetical protein
MPAERDEVVKIALLPFNATVLSTVEPSSNVTVPVGAPEAELTVAVKLTGWP